MTEQIVMPELDVFNLPVFSDADLLPMLADDEMADMVESIKANGQREPITIAKINDEWMLIDGRNRREACRQAEVEPKYRIFEGDETAIKAFILDTDTRRHNRRAQRSMRLAFMYPDMEESKGGRGKISKLTQVCVSLSRRDRQDVSMSQFIRKHDEPLGRLILAGHPNYTLSKAYDEVKAAVAERERLAEIERQKLAKLAELRNSYPDLATLVDEGRIYLDEAIETAANRIRKAQEEAERIAREAADQERRQREEEEARMAEAERQQREAERLAREDYEKRRAGFFEQLYYFINSTSIAANETQIKQLDRYVERKEWEAFSQKYRCQKRETLETLRAFAKNLPVLIQKLEIM